MANKPLTSIKFPGLSDTYTVPQVDSTLTTQGAAADAKAVGDALAGISVETDKTLTVTDKPADAKKVGDEISDIKADLNYITVPDNRVIVDGQKTYVDTRISLTGTVISGYTWNKSTGAQDSNSDGKYARFNNVGSYETLYISGTDIDADHRLYAFYTADNTFISAKSGTGASGSEQVKVVVPENADYVIVNTLYSTGDTGRDIDPACSALKVDEQDIFDNMLTAEGTATEGYAWRPGQTPLQNSSCRYIRYDTIPDSDYIYITGRAYRVSSPFISFYDSSDVLISSYGANSLTYYEAIEMAVPAGTSYFIVNGTGSTPIVKYPASITKKTQKEVNEDVNTELTNIKTILDNIDPLSDDVKTALLNCFLHVAWIDSHGQEYYDTLHDVLYGIEYIYKLDSPLTVDGSTGYLITDVAPFTEKRSFCILVDYTEGNEDFTPSVAVAHTIMQVAAPTGGYGVILSTFKTASAQNVTTRARIFNLEYIIKEPKENCGNRRIKYGISYNAETDKFICRISINGVVATPSSDPTENDVVFSQSENVINLGANYQQAEILKGTINELKIMNRTLTLSEIENYVTDIN